MAHSPFLSDSTAIFYHSVNCFLGIGVTICAWGRGKPTSYRGAADLVMAVRREIGAEAFDIHSPRYAAAAELAAAGCSDELIAAVTGHATGAMVRKYAGTARQKIRAIEAQGRRK